MKIFNRIQFIISSILITAIILVAVIFHHPINIVNALTLNPLSEFGIHILFWRIVFEPFLGVLLFFNQSFYAITELQFLLYWVLAVFIIYNLIKSVLIKDKRLKKKFIVDQLVNIPIIIGLWFVFFVITVFIPLPNNTINNSLPNTILVNTHSHTEYSHDGLISQKDLWKWHKRNGFDAFFITEHNNHSKTLDFVQSQRKHEFPSEPLIMCGEEFSGSNHLSLLGLKNDFKTRGFTDSMSVAMARRDGGAVIANHWFDGEHKTLEYYKNMGVDGFELENTATDKRYDRNVYKRIKDFCENNNLIMNGGLDFHGYGSACSIWNAFEIPGWHNLDPVSKEEAILNIIKTRDQSKLKVLLYDDRPYYSKQHLFFSTPLTIFNYFRTLNFYQIISWILWILLAIVVRNGFSNNEKLKKIFTAQRLISLLGILGALFISSLGLVYYTRIKEITDFTKMYHEYSTLLFNVGAVFLVYSALVAFFRFFKRKE